MARPRKTVEPAGPLDPPPGAGPETPAPAAPQPAADPPPAEDANLMDFHARFPQAHFVVVRRFTSDRKWESLGSVPAEVLDDDYLVNEFGPGLYTIFIRDEQGRTISDNLRIRIGDRATRKAHTQAPPIGAELAPVPALSLQVELLKSELERRDQMMLRLIDAIKGNAQPAAAPVTVMDLVNGMASLQKLQNNIPQMSFPEKLMDRAFTMATRGAAAPAAAESSDMLGFLKDVFEAVKPFIMPGAAQAAPAAAAAAAPAAGAPVAAEASATNGNGEETETVDITPWIETLKDHCRAGRDPATIAGFIQTQCAQSEQTAAVVEQLLAGDVSQVLQLDPELQMPGYATWFTKLFEVLRVRLMGGTGDSTGTGRNGTNP